MAIPVLLYGSESWTVNTGSWDETLRYMRGCNKIDGMSNEV
jgi:hypothetical protein